MRPGFNSQICPLPVNVILGLSLALPEPQFPDFLHHVPSTALLSSGGLPETVSGPWRPSERRAVWVGSMSLFLSQSPTLPRKRSKDAPWVLLGRIVQQPLPPPSKPKSPVSQEDVCVLKHWEVCFGSPWSCGFPEQLRVKGNSSSAGSSSPWLSNHVPHRGCLHLALAAVDF